MLLDKLYKLSPCPIYENNLMFFGGDYNEDKLCIRISGGWTGDNDRIVVLAHEVGHAICHKNKCKCFDIKHGMLCEFHANLFALTWLYKQHDTEALYVCIKHIISQSRKLNHSMGHARAAKFLLRTKLWKKCLDYVFGKQEQLVFDFGK